MATGDMKPDAFYDVSVLPHPKEDILLAIEREILREPSDARVEWLAVGAVFLPSFQQGIGPKPLFWVGADLADLQRSTPNVREQMKVLAQSPDRARAEQFLALMKIESDQIQARIDAALRLRRARMTSSAEAIMSPSPPQAKSPPAVRPGPSRTRPAVAAGQLSFDNAGKAVIGMDDLLPVVARYTNEPRRLLDISEEEAIRRTEH